MMHIHLTEVLKKGLLNKNALTSYTHTHTHTHTHTQEEHANRICL